MEKTKKGVINRKLIVIIFLIIYIITAGIITRGEYLEIKEIGDQYVSIFYTNVVNKWIVMGVTFFISYIVIYLTNKKMRRGLKEFFEKDNIEMPKLPNKSISFIASIIVSFIAQFVLTEKFLMFMNSAKFGMTDPIFKFDISFYMFKLPFIKTFLIFLIAYIAILTIYSACYYILTLNKFLDGIDRDTLIKNGFIKTIISNVIIVALLVAGIVILSSLEIQNGTMMNLNDEAKTEIIGAGLTEVKIKIWGYRLLALVILISVLRVIKFLKEFKVKKIVYSMLIVPVYLVGLFVVMTGFQYIYAERNELDKQRTYLAYNLKYTREGYNINIEEINLENEDDSNKDYINSYVLKNSTLITSKANLSAISEYNDSEGYYTYNTSNIGVYNVNGEKKPVYITPREIISDANRTYASKTYQYTHGYGVIVSDVSKVDEKGNVQFIQSDFDEEDVLGISEPRIYFGLTTNDTVVTSAKGKEEFDYPISSKDYKEFEYNGKAGLNANFIDRCVLAAYEKDVKLVFSSAMTSDSKILMNRNIRDRAKTLMPYFIYDEKPYIVVNDEGKMIWVLDAYTISNSYPYSQKSKINIEGSTKEINYIRNSVKVLVDAYDGTIKFYITDRTDPIAMMYRNIYPDLFAGKDESIPEDIQKNIIYPEFLYNIQAKQLERYHDVNTEILYRSGDVWSAAKVTENGKNNIKPVYTMVKTNNSKKEELGLVVSYNKLNKQSLNAYLVGKYDGENKLTLYKLPSDSNMPSIKQLQLQIEQDEEIAEELSKINTPGTRVEYNTFIVPIDKTVLYIEPIYQTMINEESNVPTLKKVIVATKDKVAIGNNLEDAILKLISDSAYDLGFINSDSEEELIEAIIKANSNLKESSETGDWQLVGNDLKELQSLINTLEDLRRNNTDEKNDETNKSDSKKSILDTILNNDKNKEDV